MNDEPWRRFLHDPAHYETLPRWPMAFSGSAFEVNSTRGLIEFIDGRLAADAIVVELGTFNGVSTVAFARRVGRVFSIDRQIRGVARLALASLPGAELIEADSIAAAERFADASIDCVYCDTDHTREQLRRELDAWFRKLKPQGVFAGHDFGAEHCRGVAEAIFERFDRVEVYADSTWTAPACSFRGPA